MSGSKNEIVLKFSSLILGVLLSVQCMGDEQDKTLTLAKSGKSDYVIIQNSNATVTEKYAAEELSYFLGKVTGAKFPVKNESDQSGAKKAIYIGWTDCAKKTLDLSSLGEEEWIIKTQGENLILTGGRPRGTLYAVYEFLETQIGCHWFDEFTEVIPSKPELSIKKLNIKDKPVFSGRAMSIWPMTNYLKRDEWTCFNVRNKETSAISVKHGMGSKYGSPGGAHTYYAYLKEWQDAHPEYLAINEKSERVRSVNTGGPGQICVTHPEGRKVILEQLRQFIIKDREKAAKDGTLPPRIYAVESNDNTLICNCPGCQAVIKQEGANSGADLALANFLADGIKDEFPDVLVDIFAYGTTLHPPKKMKAKDNVAIRFALIDDHATRATEGVAGNRSADRPDFFRPMTHPVNSLPYEMLMTWTMHAKNIHIWDYWRIYFDGKVTPYVILDTIKADLEFYQDIGIKEIFTECEPGCTVDVAFHTDISFQPLTRWVGIKLLQNPQQPLDPLIKTFMAGYYGPAADKMYEYMSYMKKRISECPETMKISRQKPEDRPYLDLTFFVTCEKLLDEAEALCASDKKALLNVRKERIPLDLSLFALWNSLKSKLPKGETMPFDNDALIKRCEAMRIEQIENFYLKEKQDKVKAHVKKEMNKQKFMLANPWTPNLRIPRIPECDGDLSKIEWAKALPIKWYSTGGPEVPERKVKGSIAHDGKYLYISLEEKIENGEFLNNEWGGDDWELFFAEQRTSSYNQIGIFPDGRMICYEYVRSGDGGASQNLWKDNSVVIAKSVNKNGNWQVQMSLPLNRIMPNGVTPGKNYFMNIFRGTPKGESLCISPVFGSMFYEANRLAVFMLEK